MEQTQRTNIASFVVASVIEENNTMCSVIIVDTVERSPTPIVIYSVEREFDSPTIENDDIQKFDNTRKLDDAMMQIGGGDGE
jgi:hypothetical protein